MQKIDVVFIGNDMDRVEIEAVFEALETHGLRGVLAHPDNMTVLLSDRRATLFLDGEPISPALIVGWVFEEVLIHGMYLLSVLEHTGFNVINTARTLFEGQNKFINSALLTAAGVPHFDVVCGKGARTLSRLAREHMQFPLVNKPLVGVGGQSVIRIDTPEAFKSMATLLDGFGQYSYMQPYISKDSNADTRVVCIGYEPVCAYTRIAPPDSWITNLVAGGKGEIVPLEPDVVKIAKLAARAINAEIAGVDVVRDADTGVLKVFEVNTCPAVNLSKYIPGADDAVERALATYLRRKIGKTGPLEQATI